MEKLLLVGSTGFVCSSIIDSFKPLGNHLLSPTSEELDILSQSSIENYIKTYEPKVLVNFAAFTDLPTAEKDRGNQKGLAWQLNVGATREIAAICQKHDVYLIHISTDGVYPGTPEFPGPYKENDIPQNDSTPLSWYGYTKLKAEEMVTQNCPNSAIIRISYPFGNLNSQRDYLFKVIKYIKAGYHMYSDEMFTPTYLDDLAKSLQIIAKDKPIGTFHVVSIGPTSPYEFSAHTAHEANLSEPVYKGLTTDSKTPSAFPRPIHGGLLANQTQTILGIKFHTWQDAITETLNKFK